MHWTNPKRLLAGLAVASVLSTAAFALPVQAASLRMAWSQDATGLDPHKQTAFSSLRLLELIYEPLVRLDANLQVVPAVAQSWEFSGDGKTLTFKLDPKAKFHDGSPVTAEDVKWSLERAIAAGGFPAIQMGASEMKSPDQFTVIDPLTIKVDFPKPNKLVLANLAVPVAQILNSKLAKSHATAEVPWALDWVGKNDAGGGAYMVESW